MGTERLGYPGSGQQESLYSFGIEERSLISRILTGSASGNVIAAAPARTCAGYRGEGKILIAPDSSRLGQHSNRRTSCQNPSEHERNRAAPALLGCRCELCGGAVEKFLAALK